jgi:hypothetical protein
VEGKRSRRNGRREGVAGATRAPYRSSEKRSTDMSEQNDLNALIQEMKNVTAALNPAACFAAAAKQAKEGADERAKEVKERAEEVREKAKEIEKKVNEKAEAKAREAKLSDDDKKHVEEIISLFNDLEPEGVLSYRIEAPVEGKPDVLRFAIKNAQPIIITISSNKVSFEKLQPDGSRETMRVSNISKPSELTRNNMMELIDKISEE